MDMSVNDLILVEFIATVSEQTDLSFKKILREIQTNKALQSDLKSFSKNFKQTIKQEIS